jgi:hypothetical protein
VEKERWHARHLEIIAGQVVQGRGLSGALKMDRHG